MAVDEKMPATPPASALWVRERSSSSSERSRDCMAFLMYELAVQRTAFSVTIESRAAEEP